MRALSGVLASAAAVDLVVNFTVAQPLHHFWRSTGWCPPEPHTPEAILAYVQQESSLQNHEHVASIAGDGIELIRIHFLLDLIVPLQGAVMGSKFDASRDLDYTKLVTVLGQFDMLGLALGFEVMGNPGGLWTDFGDAAQLAAWQDMVSVIANISTNMFGKEKVKQWRWEPWNEPDHTCSPERRLDANITCDVESWTNYVIATARGIRAVDDSYQFGGPNTGSGLLKTPFLAAILEQKSVRIDFVSWHEKGTTGGDGGSQAVTDRDLDATAAVDQLNPAPNATVTTGNSEADPLGGWNKPHAWRADARYAAMIVEVINQHLQELILTGARRNPFTYLSNDNAFLPYGDVDHLFSQRTLVGRFLYNDTTPYTQETVRKPSLMAMAV
eukprot:CAMPEP_0204361848 /NCGR_PEP_ID=MMETSP0469-20131031/39137_1 /ASSEMBLY_ACC=CAM_ASM_000384 /TAXON_ID=2969 /ORGANISM="Oxyrrhis marina" /LENGTH=384 /DNA_ID=CAMNT_0051350311 /DNA_START=27 /DNA_END=1178 /DNA_ORIENTATION=+